MYVKLCNRFRARMVLSTDDEQEKTTGTEPGLPEISGTDIGDEGGKFIKRLVSRLATKSRQFHLAAGSRGTGRSTVLGDDFINRFTSAPSYTSDLRGLDELISQKSKPKNQSSSSRMRVSN